MKIFISFLPWIVFWVLSGRSSFQTASVASTAVVFFLNFKNIRNRSIKILDIGTLLFFIFLTVISFTSKGQLVDIYASPLSSAALFLITLLSILIRKPFTLQYAREKVDHEKWNSPIFYSINLAISWVWCFSFAISTLTSYIALNHPSLVDRVIQILAFVGAIKFTSWYPGYIKSKIKK
jgi:hypothetical protein